MDDCGLHQVQIDLIAPVQSIIVVEGFVAHLTRTILCSAKAKSLCIWYSLIIAAIAAIVA